MPNISRGTKESKLLRKLRNADGEIPRYKLKDESVKHAAYRLVNKGLAEKRMNRSGFIVYDINDRGRNALQALDEMAS